MAGLAILVLVVYRRLYGSPCSTAVTCITCIVHSQRIFSGEVLRGKIAVVTQGTIHIRVFGQGGISRIVVYRRMRNRAVAGVTVLLFAGDSVYYGRYSTAMASAAVIRQAGSLADAGQVFLGERRNMAVLAISHVCGGIVISVNIRRVAGDLVTISGSVAKIALIFAKNCSICMTPVRVTGSTVLNRLVIAVAAGTVGYRVSRRVRIMTAAAAGGGGQWRDITRYIDGAGDLLGPVAA